MVFVGPAAHAQDAWVPLKRETNISIAYQHLNFDGHFDTDGSRLEHSIPSVAQLFVVGIEHGLTSKLAINVRIPFIASRFTGSDDDPDLLMLQEIAKGLNPDEKLFTLDTGGYYSTFQDFGFMVRYNLVERGVVFTPLVAATIPSHHYRTVGEAAAGQDRLAVHTGFNAGAFLDPLIPRAYLHARYFYSFVQPVYDIPLDRSNADFEVGYGVSPMLSVRALAAWQQSHGGLHWAEVLDRGLADDATRTEQLALLDH